MTTTELFPGKVLVYQPALNAYYVFLTGGLRDPCKWIFGRHKGQSMFVSLKDVGAPLRKVASGVYAIEEN